jgi:hypothetical protein
MKRWAALAACLFAYALAFGCGKAKPPSPPGPTPPPATASLLLSRNGPVFTDPQGKPVDVRGEASCCWTDDGEPDPGWALASRAFIERTAAHGNNLIHMRLGPYRVQPDWGAEQNSAGSPYLEVNGCADLTQWDQRFMAYLKDRITFGASLGVRFELDTIDGWGAKWQKWKPNQFPQGHPFVASSNCQREDWITSVGTTRPKGVHEAWLRHIVAELGGFDNVIYQVGNENGQVPGIVAAWEIGTCDIIHDEEVKRGWKRHLCGSNAPEVPGVTNNASFDFYATHEGPPISRERIGDVTRVLEQNEDNARYTGQEWFHLYCEDKARGVYRHFWRAGMPLAEAQIAWGLLKGGCAAAAPVGCFQIPNEDSVQVIPRPLPNPVWVKAINAAMKRLKPDCDIGGNCPIATGMQTWLQAVAAEVRKGDADNPALCSAVQSDGEGYVDEVAVGTTDLVTGFHAYACRPGCKTGTVGWGPGAARDSWKKPGAATMATSGVARPKPQLEPNWKTHTDRVVRPVRPREQ